jgi:hypothetical protein
LTDDQIARVAAVIRSDGVCHTQLQDERRAFLYAKEMLTSGFFSMPIVRQDKFNSLLDPDAVHFIPVREQLLAARDHLRQIMTQTEVGSSLTPGCTTFDAFAKNHPVWDDPSASYVLWRDHPGLKGKPSAFVERIQPGSGLSYMHAPIVMQHYLVQMNVAGAVGMVDMAEYLRQHESAEGLEQRIWWQHLYADGGGFSLDVLRRILVQDSVPELRLVFRNDHDRLLKKHAYGPLLVSGFEVRDDFSNTSESVHLDQRPPGFPWVPRAKRHAMVIVGYRREGRRGRLLLQNWWAQKVWLKFSRILLTLSSSRLRKWMRTILRTALPAFML